MLGLRPGARVAGRYELQRRLGQGGMGEVWSALHLITGKRIALKALKAEKAARPELVQRFFREARAATAVTHPNVVEVHDVLSFQGAPVMVMELLEGESLAELLRRQATLPLSQLAALLVPIVSAVGTAHARGIVHRDLKPENIFLARSPSGSVAPKVLDFGIAKLTYDEPSGQSSALTRTGSMVGTPFYMSPEQAAGERDFDHRCDVWALGVICFEALVGKRPFEGDNFGQVFKRIITEQAPSLAELRPDLPSDVAALVNGMLAKDRAARSELGEVLAVLGEHTDVTAPSFGPALSQLPAEASQAVEHAPLGALPALEPAATLADPNATAESSPPESSPPESSPAESSPPESSPLLETLGATTLGDALRPATQRSSSLMGLTWGALAALSLAAGAWWSLTKTTPGAGRAGVTLPHMPRAVAERAVSASLPPVPAPDTQAPPDAAPGPAASAAKPSTRPAHSPPALAAKKLRASATSASAMPARAEPEPPKKLPGGILDQDSAPF